MKAIKKAEESQQGLPGSDTPTLSELAEELSLEPAPERAAPGRSSGAEQAGGEASQADASPASAANLFAAGGRRDAESRHGRMVITLSIVALLLLAGGGAYVYVAINNPALLAFTRPASAPPAIPAVPPVALQVVPSAMPEPEKPAGLPWEEAVPERQPAPPSPPALPVAEPAPDRAITVLRGKQEEINPDLANAWQSLQEGRLETARALYQRMLRQDSRSIDALLGMAAVMARSGTPGEAGKLYLRVLDIEPRNVFAQAGLVNLLGEADPAGGEARLKQLLAEQPAAFLHFALGNLYARRERWKEAQQAYFDAHRMEAGNPDYAFNLAVSLEQIGQPRQALTYYQRAQTLLRQHGAGFDPATVEARIAQLQGVSE